MSVLFSATAISLTPRLARRRNMTIATIAAPNARAPRAIATPMPALAPVLRPELEEGLCRLLLAEFEVLAVAVLPAAAVLVVLEVWMEERGVGLKSAEEMDVVTAPAGPRGALVVEEDEAEETLDVVFSPGGLGVEGVVGLGVGVGVEGVVLLSPVITCQFAGATPANVASVTVPLHPPSPQHIQTPDAGSYCTYVVVKSTSKL